MPPSNKARVLKLLKRLFGAEYRDGTTTYEQAQERAPEVLRLLGDGFPAVFLGEYGQYHVDAFSESYIPHGDPLPMADSILLQLPLFGQLEGKRPQSVLEELSRLFPDAVHQDKGVRWEELVNRLDVMNKRIMRQNRRPSRTDPDELPMKLIGIVRSLEKKLAKAEQDAAKGDGGDVFSSGGRGDGGNGRGGGPDGDGEGPWGAIRQASNRTIVVMSFGVVGVLSTFLIGVNLDLVNFNLSQDLTFLAFVFAATSAALLVVEIVFVVFFVYELDGYSLKFRASKRAGDEGSAALPWPPQVWRDSLPGSLRWLGQLLLARYYLAALLFPSQFRRWLSKVTACRRHIRLPQRRWLRNTILVIFFLPALLYHLMRLFRFFHLSLVLGGGEKDVNVAFAYSNTRRRVPFHHLAEITYRIHYALFGIGMVLGVVALGIFVAEMILMQADMMMEMERHWD